MTSEKILQFLDKTIDILERAINRKSALRSSPEIGFSIDILSQLRGLKSNLTINSPEGLFAEIMQILEYSEYGEEIKPINNNPNDNPFKINSLVRATIAKHFLSHDDRKQLNSIVQNNDEILRLRGRREGYLQDKIDHAVNWLFSETLLKLKTIPNIEDLKSLFLNYYKNGHLFRSVELGIIGSDELSLDTEGSLSNELSKQHGRKFSN